MNECRYLEDIGEMCDIYGMDLKVAKCETFEVTLTKGEQVKWQFSTLE